VFAPCSRHMADWCHAMGVPRDKIVPVPNAPSFSVTEASLAETMTERAERGATRDLRVMYIGRLDAQKGLHRLADVIRATNARKLPVEWRVIGKAVVVEGEKQSVPDEVADVLEPPITEASDLAAAFAWADVFVLLSEYEGLPLTILEAMRSGVVTIATRVGAVDEVVSDGENGILLDLPKAVDGCVDAISRFCRDRDALKALAHAAHEAAKSWNWSAASEELMDVLERHIAGAPGK
jgi:glycosyltransferase involved in cell wall biosynthesis